jgi:5,10-methylene-tetrahydrofolate dehydrogenase/methenyl tetrahydrofolate cyclohydrolase
MTKHYKIKLEDKAAFINKVEKVGVTVDSFDIKNDKLDDTFEFTVSDPNTIKTIDTILSQSPKINQIKEQLKAMIREELKAFRNKE